jgi:hypothetical protein
VWGDDQRGLELLVEELHNVENIQYKHEGTNNLINLQTGASIATGQEWSKPSCKPGGMFHEILGHYSAKELLRVTDFGWYAAADAYFVRVIFMKRQAQKDGTSAAHGTQPLSPTELSLAKQAKNRVPVETITVGDSPRDQALVNDIDLQSESCEFLWSERGSACMKEGVFLGITNVSSGVIEGRLRFKHLRCLAPDGLVNNHVVAVYCELLGHVNMHYTSRSMAYVLSTKFATGGPHFWAALHPTPYLDKMSTGYKYNERIGVIHAHDTDLFGAARILFPINVGNKHWFALSLDIQEKKIVVLDSRKLLPSYYRRWVRSIPSNNAEQCM